MPNPIEKQRLDEEWQNDSAILKTVKDKKITVNT